MMKGKQTKERPILFSGEMVRAILEDRKTQTRRPSKGDFLTSISRACPHGQPGDVLWVRETWCDRGEDTWGNPYYEYRATAPDYDPHVLWRPSIHMPRAACRLLLRITDVIAEGFTNKSDFASAWVSIYGQYSWMRSDWVWVVKFERVQEEVPE